MHGNGIDVGIVSTAASENTKLRELPTSAQEFKKRLTEIGLEHLPIIPTIACWDLTFWDLCRFADDNSDKLVNELWSIVKPSSLPEKHVDFAVVEGIDTGTPLSSPDFAKWRNKFCDVYSLEAHIAAGRDVFVSGDTKNFKGTRKDRLVELGVKEICSYEEAIEIARSST